jgi:hypothetical protein
VLCCVKPCCVSAARYLQQCKDIGAPLEEPCWTSLLVRRQQQLRHSNLRCARALGAPGQHKLGAHPPAACANAHKPEHGVLHAWYPDSTQLWWCEEGSMLMHRALWTCHAGLVEVCKVVDATFHHRLPGPAPERPTPAAAHPPAVADLPADGPSEGQPAGSAGAAQPAPQAAAGAAVPSEAPAGGQSAAAAPAAAAADAPAAAAHEGSSPGHAARAGSGSPAPERGGDGGAASPDDDGVEVPVLGQRAAWFVRVTLQQLRLRGSRASASSLWTTIDLFVDAGVPDWLISLCASWSSALMHGAAGQQHVLVHWCTLARPKCPQSSAPRRCSACLSSTRW